MWLCLTCIMSCLSSSVYRRKWRSTTAKSCSAEPRLAPQWSTMSGIHSAQHCTTLARLDADLTDLTACPVWYICQIFTSRHILLLQFLWFRLVPVLYRVFLRRLVFAWHSAYSREPLFESHQPVSSLWQDCSSAHKHRFCPYILQGKFPRLVSKHAPTLLWFMYVTCYMFDTAPHQSTKCSGIFLHFLSGSWESSEHVSHVSL